MPSLPKHYVPAGAAASYRTMTGRDTLILRFRLPGAESFLEAEKYWVPIPVALVALT